MSIEQTDVVDFATIERGSGDLLLTISDHLPWDDRESEHLVLLQAKINTYLRFIESGEIMRKVPDSVGRNIIINIVSKYRLSQSGDAFFQKASSLIKSAGFQLQFNLMRPN